MTTEYVFDEYDRVYCSANNKYGEVTTRVPGNGTIPWYYVQFDDGTMDRFTKDDLEKV